MSWSPSAPAWPAPDGQSWRSWRTGSWPSGRSAWSPTGPWRSAAGPPPSCWRSSSGWSPRHRPDGRADRRGLPSGRARRPGRASDRRAGPAGDGPRPVPGRPRRRPGRGASRDGQDLRPGHRPPCLAAGRLSAPGRRPDRDRHPEPAGRGVRGRGHLRPAPGRPRSRPGATDARTVLVVDEAGMVGSRKLTRLLEHADQAQAKVVLVGDDRQLAPIDAGGGFRALRLRLGASELVENRRQQQAWEREALDLVRSGLVEEAVAAYQAHDRVVAADSKPAATLALLQDWWTASSRPSTTRPKRSSCWPPAGPRSTGSTPPARNSSLPGPPRRRAAPGRGPPAGRRGPGRVRPQRHRRVRGGQRQPRHHHRPRPPSPNPDHPLGRQDGREVVLPRSYLDGRGRGERNRRVDLAYATTGHRAQGLTRGRALVRLTGSEDVNWLYVQLSRARHDTRLYAVVGPNPREAGSWTCPTASNPTGTSSWPRPCPGSAADPGHRHPHNLDLQRLSTAELRAERIGSAANSSRPPATAAGNSPGRRPPPAGQGTLAAHQQPTDRERAGSLRWLRRGHDHTAQVRVVRGSHAAG